MSRTFKYTFTLHIDVHCTRYSEPTLYRVHCTVYFVPCTLYCVHCTVYIVPCTLYRVHCTVYIVRCTLYRVPCTTYIGCIQTIELYTMTLKFLCRESRVTFRVPHTMSGLILHCDLNSISVTTKSGLLQSTT